VLRNTLVGSKIVVSMSRTGTVINNRMCTISFPQTDPPNNGERKVEGVGVMKDKEVKLEEIEFVIINTLLAKRVTPFLKHTQKSNIQFYL
jgi:hypothetical protein